MNSKRRIHDAIVGVVVMAGVEVGAGSCAR